MSRQGRPGTTKLWQDSQAEGFGQRTSSINLEKTLPHVAKLRYRRAACGVNATERISGSKWRAVTGPKCGGSRDSTVLYLRTTGAGQ